MSGKWLRLWNWLLLTLLRTIIKMERKLSRVYYSPKGLWKGLAVVKKLAKEAGVSEDNAKLWLMKQAIWKIYLPTPKHIPRPTFDVESPNVVHLADLLFLPHDRLWRGKKFNKYVLTIVNVASRFKAAEPLTPKDSSEVWKVFQIIYKPGPKDGLKLFRLILGVNSWVEEVSRSCFGFE